MISNNEILKNKPDYEEYTANEVKLTLEEMKALGMLKCGGCCSKKNNNDGGCSKNCGNGGKCCRK